MKERLVAEFPSVVVAPRTVSFGADAVVQPAGRAPALT
jgi:hypothetical protein